mmetsp:Transcript_18654/g.46851  ORF Transcript_18654/g.46851 Transcript_18654/m.46851 type:complete len:300 (+) Transcript_18654:56-955(+)|eukprot:CAMPEP_0115270502 /NCGR_PEP_ID=MMETSP0270-20121206/53603_1 /TAXON_ID=71861 /ORGANISM="Scrippsiella trochoidea, Strain CCMP3099" /LENGTH=299 /DNA_ID=CAMNT_0002686805 /DNA_START=56 /DNA_END=955 /DNA_ORIENTATION=+
MAMLTSIFQCKCFSVDEPEVEMELVSAFAYTDEVMPVHSGCGTATDCDVVKLVETSPVAESTDTEAESECSYDDCDVDSEIRICIRRLFTGEPLGIYLDKSDSRLLHVWGLKLSDSPVALHNGQAAEGERLQVGDYIVQVNDVRGDSRAMMQMMNAGYKVQLIVRRSHKFVVDIDKKGRKLGLEVKYGVEGRSVVVQAVLPGPVREWSDAQPALAVRPGDRIISVNNIMGQDHGPQGILEGLGAKSQLKITLTRPAGPEVPWLGEKMNTARLARSVTWPSRLHQRHKGAHGCLSEQMVV